MLLEFLGGLALLLGVQCFFLVNSNTSIVFQRQLPHELEEAGVFGGPLPQSFEFAGGAAAVLAP